MLSSDERTAVEDKCDAVCALRQWNESAVRLRLEQHEQMAEVRAGLVLASTGGWHILLDELQKRAKGATDLKPFTVDLQNDLKNINGTFARRFREALGIEIAGPVAEQIFDLVRREKIVPNDFELISGLLSMGEDRVDVNDCAAAINTLLHLGCISESDTGDLQADALVSMVYG